MITPERKRKTLKTRLTTGRRPYTSWFRLTGRSAWQARVAPTQPVRRRSSVSCATLVTLDKEVQEKLSK